MWLVFFAGVLFVGTYIGISSSPLRARLVTVLGEHGYRGFYSLVALLTLGNLVWLYGEVPRHDYVWMPAPSLYWVPKLAMPVAFILAVGGLMGGNTTAADSTMTDRQLHTRGARGILRVTRHPFQWAMTLWAVSHIVANGDTVSIVFFATFAVLSLTDTVLIDRKKSAAAVSSGWESLAASTSNLPFAAIINGRNRLVIGELIAPVAVGFAAYGAVYWLHQWVSGARLM